MVTDESGIPLEFKYTEPVKPTRIQTILYGGSLERYIKQEVIRGKLFKALSNKPEIIFIDNSDPSMLGKTEGIPVLIIQRAPIKGVEQVGATLQPRDNELVIREHENRNPLRFVSHADDDDVLNAVSNLVGEIGYSFDIAEPLSRVESAIEALLKEPVRKE
jgi:hypothetical protein